MPAFKLFQKRWVLLVLLVILFFLVLGLNARLSEFFRLTSQRKEMRSRIEDLEATSEALQTEIAFAKSEKAVEEWARTYERMGEEGDQMVIPLPPKEITPETNYFPTAIPADSENWQIWWELIFGE